MKKIITILSTIALVATCAMTISCNKIENDNGPRINPDGSITYTTILHMSADTKTIIGEDGTHTFKEGDQIAVTYMNTSNDQVKAISNPLTEADIENSNKSARFTVTLTEEPKTGEDRNYLYYTYPASMTTADGGIDYSKLNSQHGTLDLLASNLDCCQAYSLWNGTDDLPTRTLTNMITIGKFTIKNPSGTAINDDLTSVTIRDGSNTYVITPAGASTFTSDPIWVAMKPIYEGTSVTVTATDGTDNYTKTVTIASGKDLDAGMITPINVTMTLLWNGNLAALTSSSTEEFATARDGMTIYGTLGVNKKVSIADGATVTLDNASINADGTWTTDPYAGLTCLGNATIILSGTNTVTGFYEDYPGIQAAHNTGSGDEYTLTIQGSGSLTASSNGWGAGIGGGYEIPCDNIVINGGNIVATGGGNAAGIGGGDETNCGDITISGGNIEATGGDYATGVGQNAAGIGGGGGNCGDITISGGNITANGGEQCAAGIGTGNGKTCGNIIISGGSITANGGVSGAGIGTGADGTCLNITISGGSITANGGDGGAGIGSGFDGSCGSITINNTVTSVTATKGKDATNSIGAGESGTCGTVTIGGVVGAITESPYTYPTPAPAYYSGSVGQVITSDGGLYDNVAAATAASKTPVAMIAYVGSSSDCAHGLAIALADETGTMNFTTAGTTVAGKTAITGGTWRVPTSDDWQYMAIGCGSDQAYNSSHSFSTLESVWLRYNYINDKLTTAAGSGATINTNAYYWSGTTMDEDSGYAFSLDTDQYEFQPYNKTSSTVLRAVLAY